MSLTDVDSLLRSQKLAKKLIDDYTDQSALIVAEFKRTMGEDDYETLLDLLARLDPMVRD